MADLGADPEDVGSAHSRSRLPMWVVRDLPYLALSILGIVGMCWTTLSTRPTAAYWAMLTPAAAVLCIVAGWGQFQGAGGWTRLVSSQVLQWIAILLAMYLVTISDVKGLLNDDATGLMLLTLLALGVFISGVYLWAWRLAVVGAFLAAAVPVTAWVEQAALLLSLIGLALIAIGILNWWLTSRAASRTVA